MRSACARERAIDAACGGAARRRRAPTRAGDRARRGPRARARRRARASPTRRPLDAIEHAPRDLARGVIAVPRAHGRQLGLRRARRRRRCRGPPRTAARCIRLRPGAWSSRITTRAVAARDVQRRRCVDREHGARRAAARRVGARAEQLHDLTAQRSPAHPATDRRRGSAPRRCAPAARSRSHRRPSSASARASRARDPADAARACPPRSRRSPRAARRRRAARAARTARPTSRRDRSRSRRSSSTGPVSMPSSSCMMRDAGLGIAVDHRPLDRRGAAILRQQRRVHVDAAARQRLEHGLRQDLAVRDDDRELGARSRAARSRSSPVRADFGWITGSPSSSAATFTAGAVSWPPRPAGLSGCETTSATSCCAARARAGTAPRTRASP